VAGIDECSYCDVAVGPSAACKTAAKQTKPNELLLIIMSFLQQMTSFTNEDTQTDSSHASSSSLDMMIGFTRENI
jgi:hypothetical protein